MIYDAPVRMITRAIAMVISAALLGCAGPKVQMTVVQPPSVAEALKLKRIAMGEFEGNPNEAAGFVNAVGNLLTSVTIQGKPYFEIVPVQETASALKTKKRSFKDLARPDVVKSVSSSLKADGIFLGSIVRSDSNDSPYQEQRSQCAQSRIRYNKKGNPVGEDCIAWSHYTVNCINRDAVFEFVPRLVEAATSRSIFSDRLKGSASDKGCSDSQQPLADGTGLLAQARRDVLEQIRVALAPVESRVFAEVMDDDGEMRSKQSAPKFASGFEFAKAGRMDRACEIWKELEPIENDYVPLLYNIGLCEESSGNEVTARDYFIRADKLSPKPDNRIATALARIEKQNASKQILTKARPDIFYRSAQARTVEQDQKMYGYTRPTKNTEVKIRNSTASPEMVRAGDTLKIAMDYSVMAPKGSKSINVQEVMVLKKEGKVLTTLIEESVSRSLGGSISEVDFKIPAKMPSGTYVIEQKVQAGTSYDVRTAVFVVGS